MSSRSRASSQQPNRKEAVEALRRQQRAAERRKTLLFVGLAALVGLALIAAAAVPLINDWRNDPTKKSIVSFGVPAAQASCDPATDDPASGTGDHVGPGLDDTTKVDYATVPPAFGKHFAAPDLSGRNYYSADDDPKVEELVHNLEHGYTILWFAPSVSDADRETLEALSKKIAAMPETAAGNSGKFKAVELPEGYGDLPADKPFALAHWSGKAEGAASEFAHRQLCGKLSGEAVEAFVKKYPAVDAPESGAS